jgi:antitoxin ParD1/3/4
MDTVTISVPPSLKTFVEREVATKGYGNVSEYFRSLLREAQAHEAHARLEALLLEGLQSGEPIPVNREFWQGLRAEAQKLIEAAAVPRIKRRSRRKLGQLQSHAALSTAVPGLIDTHRLEIETLCRRYGVRRLALFGSILRQDFSLTTSDIDVAVEFGPPTGDSAARQYFDFKCELERLLARSVDLVELDAMPDTRLKRNIERTKMPIYAAAA